MGLGQPFLIVHIASYFEFVGLVVKTQLFTSEMFLFFKSLQRTSPFLSGNRFSFLIDLAVQVLHYDHSRMGFLLITCSPTIKELKIKKVK